MISDNILYILVTTIATTSFPHLITDTLIELIFQFIKRIESVVVAGRKDQVLQLRGRLETIFVQ
jgi:hypothetical protein